MKAIIAAATDDGVQILKPSDEPTDYALHSHSLRGRKCTCVTVQGGEIYVGTEGAHVFSSRDGENWTARYEGLTKNKIYSISNHPTQARGLLVGTSPPAVYETLDGGENWRQLTGIESVPGAVHWTFPPPTYMARVVSAFRHPAQPSVVLAGIRAGGIAASLDDGATWVDRHNGLARSVRQVCLPIQEPGRLYAATESGFFRSDDLGGEWKESNSGLPYLFAEALAVDPNDANRLMLASHKLREGEIAGIFRSQDGGQSWQISHTGLPSFYNIRITVLIAHGNGWYAATDKGDLFGTLDFGEMWARMESGMARVNGLAVLAEG